MRPLGSLVSMGWLYPLAQVHQQPPAHSGELAYRLAHLSRAGYPVSPTWVISAAAFEQGLQTLAQREPLLADWPHLLWQPIPSAEPQTDLTAGHIPPALAQQLRRSLMRATAPDLPWSSLLQGTTAPILRLIPSLWLGDGYPTIGVAQLLGEQLCWATPSALSLAIKRLWASAISGRCWAYWQHTQPPPQFHLAVVVQPVDPVQVSGTLIRQGAGSCLQMIRGLPVGFNESIPDRYESNGAQLTSACWQQGQQEQVYQPLTHPSPLETRGHTATEQDTYFKSIAITETALQRVEPQSWQALERWATEASAADAAPFHWHWQLPMAGHIPIITQAWAWPFKPNQVYPRRPTTGNSLQWVGRPAAPGQVIAPAVVIAPDHPLPDQAHHHIVVAHSIAPDWLPFLKTAIAIVCEQGGLACHGAILARELGIPAVVGVPGITKALHTGDQLRLDGDLGTIERLQRTSPALVPQATMPSTQVTLPDRWADCRTELWVNLTQPESAIRAAAWPIAGVGLLRSEWLILPCLQQRHPYHWLAQGEGEQLQTKLIEQLRPILAAFAPRPVRYRSLDLRSHELTTLLGGPPPEVNPVLGVRGTFSYQQHPDLFQLELNALRILQKEGFTNVQLLLPFVRTVEEFRYCQGQVEATRLDLVADFQLWIMAEVPSVLFLLSDYVDAGVQGIAIGSNDFTQLLLGVDRDQAIFSATFDERQPAVQAAIAHLLQQAQALDLPTSICGMAPARYPEIIPALVQHKITGISVDQPALAATAAAIAQAEAQRSP